MDSTRLIKSWPVAARQLTPRMMNEVSDVGGCSYVVDLNGLEECPQVSSQLSISSVFQRAWWFLVGLIPFDGARVESHRNTHEIRLMNPNVKWLHCNLITGFAAPIHCHQCHQLRSSVMSGSSYFDVLGQYRCRTTG